MTRRRSTTQRGTFVFALALSLVAGTAALPIRAAYAEGGESKAVGPVYLRLKPITFSVIGANNRIDRQIGALLQVQLASGKTAEQGEAFRRLIEDRFLISLSELWDDRPLDAPPVTAEEIKQQLLKAAAEITGPGVVDAVLIQELSERRR